MRYQKPMVMDLSAGARASGQGPLGCYNGNNPGGGIPVCGTGTNPTDFGDVCRPGGTVISYQVCAYGAAPTTGPGNPVCSNGTILGNNDSCQQGASAIP